MPPEHRINGMATMHGSPTGLIQNRAAIDVLHFERRPAFEKQLDRLQLSANRRPVQAGLSVSVLRTQMDTPPQQEIDDGGSTVLTSPPEACLQLRFRGIRFQTAVVVEELLDRIEPSHSGRPLEIQSRAMVREKLSGLWTPIGQRRCQWLPSS